jgi:hypothetical protein
VPAVLDLIGWAKETGPRSFLSDQGRADRTRVPELRRWLTPAAFFVGELCLPVCLA